MRVLSILSRKGGAGKTTLTLHLAVAAQQSGLRVLVMDSDPQASALSWYGKRDDGMPHIIKVCTTKIPKAMRASRDYGIDLVLMDTPPHTRQVASVAAQNSDLVLIPTRPSILDIESIGGTVELVKAAGRPAVIVLNACPTNSPVVGEAREVLAGYGVPVAPMSIGNRMAFQHALNSGHAVSEFEPASKATAELFALWQWISWMLSLSGDLTKAVA